MRVKSVFAVCCLLLTLVTNAQQNKEQMIIVSKDIAARLINHSYDSIVLYFDSTLTKQLTVEQLDQTLSGLETVSGKLTSAAEPVLEVFAEKSIVRTKLDFEKYPMLLSLTFGLDGKIKGMFISNFAGFYTMPYYVKSLSFLESKCEFGKEGWKVGGTLSYPRDEQKHPLVIIVHGSGPMDRDGSAGNSKVYRDLAWGLASNGICVFRYDKRSNVHGGKLYMETYKGNDYTAYDEIVEDVLFAIERMKQNPHVDTNNIYVVGHSQGGMMLPLIAQKTKLKGMVMLAANARPIQDMLIEQMNYLFPDGGSISLNEYNERNKIIAQANFAKKKKLPKDTPTDSLPFNVRANYWNYLNQYNQVKTFKKLKLPVLVLQGERDYQVTMTDFGMWQKAALKRKGPTQFISYPKLNHLFIAGEGPSKPAEYQMPGSMDVKVVTDIATWIKEAK